MKPQSARLHELERLLRLATPLAAAHAGNQLMTVVDTAIVGRLGAVELAAVGLASNLFFPVMVLGMGAMMGFDPLVSQALGAGDERRARWLLWQGVWLAVATGLLLAVPMALLPAILGPIGIAPEVARKATQYILVRTAGLVPLFLYVGLRSYLQAVGVTRPMIVAVVVANLFNAGCTLLLVFGGASLPAWTGPLRLVPPLGVIGAAVATVLCTVLQVAIVALAVRAIPAPALGAGERRLDRAEVRTAVRLGLPVGLQMAAEVGVFALVGLLVGRLGSAELAAHQIALTLASFSFSIAVGFGAAGSVRVGRAIGARDAAGTRRAGFVALAGGGGGMALWSLLFLAMPEGFAALLSDEAEVIRTAAPLLLVAAAFQVFDGLQAVGAGILRGAGDTRFAFVANLVGHYAVGLPVAILLGYHADLGVTGLWWGLCTGLIAVALTLAFRFARLSARPIAPIAPGAAADPALTG